MMIKKRKINKDKTKANIFHVNNNEREKKTNLSNINLIYVFLRFRGRGKLMKVNLKENISEKWDEESERSWWKEKKNYKKEKRR